MLRVSSSIALMLLALCLFSNPVAAGDDEIWMESAIKEAERDGYKLIDSKGLDDWLKSGEDVLVIDVRADYEFTDGHIPDAMNLEFDLGDRMQLSQTKRAAFAKLLGPDKEQKIVLYCRSFR